MATTPNPQLHSIIVLGTDRYAVKQCHTIPAIITVLMNEAHDMIMLHNKLIIDNTMNNEAVDLCL